MTAPGVPGLPDWKARATFPRESGGRHALLPKTSRRLPNCTLIPLTGAPVPLVSTSSEVSRPTTAGFDSRTSNPGAGDEPAPLPGAVPAAQPGRVTVSRISVTPPLRARSRPSTAAPSCTAIAVDARRLPRNTLLAPSVAAPPTCQKTLHAWAPFTRPTLLPGAVTSADGTWRMNAARGSPCASSVRRPLSASGATDPAR